MDALGPEHPEFVKLISSLQCFVCAKARKCWACHDRGHYGISVLGRTWAIQCVGVAQADTSDRAAWHVQ